MHLFKGARLTPFEFPGGDKKRGCLCGNGTLLTGAARAAVTEFRSLLEAVWKVGRWKSRAAERATHTLLGRGFIWPQWCNRNRRVTGGTGEEFTGHNCGSPEVASPTLLSPPPGGSPPLPSHLLHPQLCPVTGLAWPVRPSRVTAGSMQLEQGGIGHAGRQVSRWACSGQGLETHREPSV